MQPTRTGILGGRFDPIHVGHLDAAKVARQRLTLETVLVVPSRTAPHRATPAQASNADRLAMVTLATDQHAYLEPCDVELTAEGPSYTAITLSRLHELGHPPASLFFILGADTFQEIATWYDYPRVLDAAHFVVVARPGHPVVPLVDTLPDVRPRMQIAPEHEVCVVPPTPTVFLLDAVTTDVSSTRVRADVSRGTPLTRRVPTVVATYIERHRLYERDQVGTPLA
ncbi:MAG: nicotinate-nucleotide adenylyltransferase [Acidobacteriota bacterium]|nr:nicotinate-nucleotide adenylyltransferase [Acidobacteriota bacterium]